jgi:hypothetical protein
MIDGIPIYLPATFLLTTLITIGILFRSMRSIRPVGIAGYLLVFVLPFWMVVTAILASGGFYRKFEVLPPRVFTFAVLPALFLIAIYFLLFRKSFVERLSLTELTLLHVIRIPVEMVLLWLFQNGSIPEVMTFEGRNYDILSGLTAPLAYWFGFDDKGPKRGFLIAWNLLALGLLANIVITAVFSFPSPMQRFGFEQPNVGVTYFPFIWLPAIVVPIVLFAHLASLWKLLGRK